MRLRWIAVPIVLAVLCVLSGMSIDAAPLQRDSLAEPQDVLVPAAVGAPLTSIDAQPLHDAPQDQPHDSSRGYKCEDAFRRWRNSDDSQRFVVWMARCTPAGWAAAQQLSIENDANKQHLAVWSSPHIPFGIVLSGRYQSKWMTQIVFRRGPFVVEVLVESSRYELGQYSALLSHLAVAQWNKTPGVPGRPLATPDLDGNFTDMLAAIAAVVFLVFMSAQSVGWLKNRRRARHATSAYPLDTGELLWRDVGPQAEHSNRRVWRRFWVTIGGMCLALALPIGSPLTSVSIALLSFRLVLGRRFQPGQRKIWGKHAASDLNTGRNKGPRTFWFGAALALLILTVLVLCVVGIIARMMVAAVTGGGPVNTGPIGSNLRWDSAVVEGTGWLLRPLRLLWTPMLVVDLVGVAVVLAFAMSACYRRARRLAALDTTERLRKDTRAPIIYLRNFADDTVTMRTSPLTRRSGLDKIRLQQFESFEEVLVRYLTAFGPVTAVNNPGLGKAPLGAARESLSHDDWQETIRQRIESSALIVVGAGPAVATPGLSWELNTIVSCGALSRTLFVLPPHPHAELSDRWAAFRSMSENLPVPARTAEYLDRALLLRVDESGRWTAWHADTRIDWAYAFALSDAAEQVMAQA